MKNHLLWKMGDVLAGSTGCRPPEVDERRSVGITS